ncbi:MAG: hypothetical protein QOF28_659, partial [Actinomycetota bacterium]|nr:hypothetical protein [Actinomycetota bacterium]
MTSSESPAIPATLTVEATGP